MARSNLIVPTPRLGEGDEVVTIDTPCRPREYDGIVVACIDPKYSPARKKLQERFGITSPFPLIMPGGVSEMYESGQHPSWVEFLTGYVVPQLVRSREGARLVIIVHANCLYARFAHLDQRSQLFHVQSFARTFQEASPASTIRAFWQHEREGKTRFHPIHY